jgi:thiamine transporter ThiT
MERTRKLAREMAHTEARPNIGRYRRYLNRARAGIVMFFASFAANGQAVNCSSLLDATRWDFGTYEAAMQ